ncbi:MAG: DUF6639 family protein [Burkholderiales bacterium]
MCVALAAALPCVAPLPAAAQPVLAGAQDGVPCPDAPIAVRGSDAEDRADLCSGAAAAVAFLADHGLDAPGRITVEIVSRMPAGYAPDAAGCFDTARKLVLLLDHAAFARFGRWMGRPIDRVMHRAIAAHEVAHAVSATHFLVRRPRVVAREYIAYVAMYATMDPALRAHALAVFPEVSWADDAPPDEAEYAADPMRFGARAWRHWLEPGHGARFLRAVVEGRVLDGDEP